MVYTPVRFDEYGNSVPVGAYYFTGTIAVGSSRRASSPDVIAVSWTSERFSPGADSGSTDGTTYDGWTSFGDNCSNTLSFVMSSVRSWTVPSKLCFPWKEGFCDIRIRERQPELLAAVRWKDRPSGWRCYMPEHGPIRRTVRNIQGMVVYGLCQCQESLYE